jgi:thymidylate kinase
MLRRGRLVVFLGPVGIGKSAIIRGLTQVLRARGLKVSTVFVKAFHGPSYALWVLTVKMLGIDGCYAPWFAIPKSGRVGLAKVLATLSMYFDALFSIPLKLAKIRLFKGVGYHVISEDYLYSTLLDYAYTIVDLKMKSRFASIPMRVLNVFLTKYTPDSVIVLMASASELKRRWAMRGYGDPQPHYIAMQYVFLSKLDHALIIDTTGMSIKEAINKVLSGAILGAS